MAPPRSLCRSLVPAHVPVLWVLFQTLASQGAHGATFADACLKACDRYESCFLYENVEYCAQQCVSGRCNDATELCVLQGVECAQAPCLPVAICEPRVGDPSASSDEDTPAASNTVCSRSCPMLDSPVCASDGISYANMCYFEEAQCRDLGISLTNKGLCAADRAFNLQYNPPSGAATSSSSPPVAPSGGVACDAIVCADVEDPVCTSSGTLKNACFLKREQCRFPSVEMLSRGPCGPLALLPRCPASCTQEFVPVCASSGVMYANECLFRQAKCARAFARGFVAKDLSECELDVGDSTSTVQGYWTVITSVFD